MNDIKINMSVGSMFGVNAKFQETRNQRGSKSLVVNETSELEVLVHVQLDPMFQL